MNRVLHAFSIKSSLTPILGLLVFILALPVLRVPRPTTRVLYVAPIARGSGDCSDWANACNLQTALAQAQSGDEIWVQQGIYKPTTNPDDPMASFILQTGVALYGGFAGTETSRDARDWVANPSVLSGDIDNNDLVDARGVVSHTAGIIGTNSYHVVYAEGVDNTTVLDGFIVTAGKTAGTYTDPHSNGGGMYIRNGSPVLRNLTFVGNTTTDWSYGSGGGLYNWAGNPSLTNVTFSENSAYYGGGMYNYGNPTLTNVTFNENQADYLGGGMYNSGSPMLRDIIFTNNSAAWGGGMYTSGDLTLIGATFAGNEANQYGGGMYSNGRPMLTNVSFVGNSSFTGGGIYNQGQPMLTNVSFVGNSSFIGGGMYNQGQSILINTTFSGNSATSGGGIYNYGSLILANAILWGNSAFIGSQIYNLGSQVRVLYSDIQGCGGSGAGWKPVCGEDGGGNIDADPRFMDAAGGNLRLRLGSPCIDAGDNSVIPADVTTDLDGKPRFADIPEIPDTGKGTPPIVDMGAYEVQRLSYRVCLPLALRNAR